MKQSRHDLEKLYAKYNDLSVPDKNFNERKARALIKETMEEAERYHNTVGKAIDDSLGERIEAVSAYGRYRFNRGVKSPQEYFGKQQWNAFVGEKLLEKLKIAKSAEMFGKKEKIVLL